MFKAAKTSLFQTSSTKRLTLALFRWVIHLLLPFKYFALVVNLSFSRFYFLLFSLSLNSFSCLSWFLLFSQGISLLFSNVSGVYFIFYCVFCFLSIMLSFLYSVYYAGLSVFCLLFLSFTNSILSHSLALLSFSLSL